MIGKNNSYKIDKMRCQFADRSRNYSQTMPHYRSMLHRKI